jgi:hypothetical protein
MKKQLQVVGWFLIVLTLYCLSPREFWSGFIFGGFFWVVWELIIDVIEKQIKGNK